MSRGAPVVKASAFAKTAVARIRLSEHDGGTRVAIRFGKLHNAWTPALVLVRARHDDRGGIPKALQTGEVTLALIATIVALVPLVLAALWTVFVKQRADDRDRIAAALADCLRAMPSEVAAMGGGYRVAGPQVRVDPALEEEEWPDSTGEVRKKSS